MSEWKEATLGEIAVLNYGKSLTVNNRKKGNIPVFSSAGQTGWHNQSLVNDQGIIIGRKGSIGTVYYSDKPFFCIDTAYYIVENKEKYVLKYLYYLLIYLRLDKLNEDSAVPGLNRETAYSQYVKLPSLEEQQKIAAVLSCLDAKIDNLRRQNETLEKMAQTLFKHWFIDFEFPNNEGKSYKSSGGVMVDSELGEIPAGWMVGKLGDVANITSSKRIFMSEYTDTGVPFYRSKEIRQLQAGQNITTELYIAETRFQEIKEKFGVPQCGDILLTSVGTIGTPYIVKKHDRFYFKDGNLTWIKDFQKGFNGIFIYYWLKNSLTQQQIQINAIGTTQKALTIQSLNNLDLIIPADHILSNYSIFLNPIHSKYETNTKQIQTITKIRDELLPKLMSGEIRVKDEEVN